MDSNSLLLSLIDKAVAGMEDAEVVDVLYVTLLEFRVDTEPLASEVQRVQRFCLRLRDRRNVGTSWQCAESYKVSSPILQ